MMTFEQYLAPATLEEAARVAGATGAAVLAGGTDLLLRCSAGLRESPRSVVDLKRIADLRGIRQADGEICVGACTLMNELVADPVICAAAPVLGQAAGRIACPQIRNRATIGGNLCNASPAADTATALLLDAVVDLVRLEDGQLCTREVPIADFFRGPGSTVLAAGEILACVRFRPPGPRVYAAWDKFGTRPAMDIAVASVGVALEREHDTVTRARVAYGSVAPTPLRGQQTEGCLLGQTLSTDVIERCENAAREEIAPISDVRASDSFRRQIVGVMIRRMLQRAHSA